MYLASSAYLLNITAGDVLSVFFSSPDDTVAMTATAAAVGPIRPAGTSVQLTTHQIH